MSPKLHSVLFGQRWTIGRSSRRQEALVLFLHAWGGVKLCVVFLLVLILSLNWCSLFFFQCIILAITQVVHIRNFRQWNALHIRFLWSSLAPWKQWREIYITNSRIYHLYLASWTKLVCLTSIMAVVTDIHTLVDI